jgi:Fic family protein
MEALFAKTRDEMSKMATTSSNGLDESEIEKIIKIAAEFLNRFLYIHPYSNGNGRVARILTSYLLSRVSVVPVSLTEGSQRQTYLDCLRQIHSTGNLDQPPIALATLLLERVFYSLDFFSKIILEA